ncbi:MAG TPA: class II glutamine amidotransferase [Pseudothermotoga sp.]|nr:class II glutamine amidotransferase [Pseudothermotoga sp.]HOK83547.1 class II glutamine amidotransferase [Pseudothermotoga sp.]HPP69620.1 class II glutamine amidotransferase [Pseudothermotoga sp.]
MCRMIGFSFDKQTVVTVLFEHLQHMAQRGKGAPHNHGWGLYALKDDAVVYYRSPRPAYEETIVPFSAQVGIMHARKASEHLPVTFLQLHPFIDNKGKAFCHNGTIFDIPQFSIESDTYSYFVRIKDYQDYQQLSENVKTVTHSYRHTGMNFLMVDGERLIVYCGYSENADYYTLWYDDSNGFVVCSEPMSHSFKPMENRSLFVIENGKLITTLKI